MYEPPAGIPESMQHYLRMWSERNTSNIEGHPSNIEEHPSNINYQQIQRRQTQHSFNCPYANYFYNSLAA